MYYIISAVIFSIFLMGTTAMDNLNEVFRWKVIDFAFRSDDERSMAVRNETYNPYNHFPIGLEVWKEKLFITVPRWKKGVSASLAYIHLSDPKEAPLLHPYPSWDWHNLDSPKIFSPFRVRADSCDRLWVMDSGHINLLGGEKGRKPQLLIFDLKTDELIKNYTIPEDQYDPNRNLFSNVAVEENNCKDSFAYLSDTSHPGMVVYSFEQDRSWLVQHHYFSLDPLAGNMSVGKVNFQWEDGLFGMALSEPRKDGYSSLYFHPMISFNEFNVSTKVLRNEELVKSRNSTLYHEFHMLGTRGPKSESGASFYHKKSKVLFYALLQLSAIACWRTSNPNYTMESQGRIFMSNETMLFPSDLKVDHNDTLWVFSDSLPLLMYGELNHSKYNFRIFNQTVAEAIRATACDSKIVVNKTLVDSMGKPKSGIEKLQADVYAFILIVMCAIVLR